MEEIDLKKVEGQLIKSQKTFLPANSDFKTFFRENRGFSRSHKEVWQLVLQLGTSSTLLLNLFPP